MSGTLPAPVTNQPTAMHLVELAQETLESWLPELPLGLGVGCVDHAVPFHDSANVTDPDDPTAVHSLAVMQETPAIAPGPDAMVNHGTDAPAVAASDAIPPNVTATKSPQTSTSPDTDPPMDCVA